MVLRTRCVSYVLPGLGQYLLLTMYVLPSELIHNISLAMYTAFADISHNILLDTYVTLADIFYNVLFTVVCV